MDWLWGRSSGSDRPTAAASRQKDEPCKSREADKKDPVAYLKYFKLEQEIQDRALGYFWASAGRAGGETNQRLRKTPKGVSEGRF